MIRGLLALRRGRRDTGDDAAQANPPDPGGASDAGTGQTEAGHAAAQTDDNDELDVATMPDVEVDGDVEPVDSADLRRRTDWRRILVFVALPVIALTMAASAGYLKWLDSSMRDREVAGAESVQAAKDSTIAMLSYQAATADQQLHSARALLTGTFKDSYTSLINDVVIPGATQKQITATASVPGAASVSANESHAVALVFVDQSVSIGNTAPTGNSSETTSAVRVTLDKVDGRWLVAAFDPI